MHYFWKKDEANWNEMGILSFNNFTGAFDDTTFIPAFRRLKIVLADGFNIGDDEANVEISDSLKIIQRSAKRSFILFKNNTPVGWATFHRDHSYVPVDDTTEDIAEETEEPTTEETDEQEVPVEFED